jgi:branched-chain amino acid transport system permease protein
MLLGTLIYGLITSATLALLSIGFNITFGISGVANFAYGALYVITGFGAWILCNMLGFPYPLAAMFAVLFSALFSALVYRFFLLRLRGMVLSEVIATFAMGLAILELFRYSGFIGSSYTLPVFFEGSLFIKGIYVDAQRLFVVGIAAGATLLLWLFTRHTRTGRAFRAISQNEFTAMTLGIDSDWTATLSMAFGAAYVSLAAIVILPLGTISPMAGYGILINALAVCIVGGLGSTGGVLIASLIIGYAQQFTESYVGTHWIMIVSLLAIFLVLCIRPSGLLGHQKELEERI